MRILFYFLLLSFVWVSCSESAPSLGGVITSGNNSIATKINLVSTDGSTKEASSGQNGQYEFKDLKNGSYLLMTQSDKTVTPDEQLAMFVQHKAEIEKYFKQPVSNENIEALKVQRDQSIGVDAMNFAHQVQQATDDAVSRWAKQAKMEWDPGKQGNKMIFIQEVEVKGETTKDIKM
jgi:hypothetical protein